MTIALAITTVAFLTLAFVSTERIDVGTYSFCSGILVTTFVFIMWLFPHIESEGYKKGQVDCVKGDIKYEMSTKKDTTWVEK